MNIPWLVLPALLLEAIFYFLPASAAFQRRFQKVNPWAQAFLLSASALLPVAWINLAAGQSLTSLYWLAAAVLLVCFWPLILPAKPLSDLILMAILAAFILSPWFKACYPTPPGGPRLDAIAKLLWLRLGIAIFLFPRRYRVPGFSLLPSRRDWLIGAREFLIFFALLLPGGLYFGILRYQLPNVELIWIPFLALGTFLGIYLFVAYGEEFFFRGILQPLLVRGLGSNWAGTVLACALFGAVHLPYRNFPNWRFALLAAVAGYFYSRAFSAANSLRAAMIAHALVVTAWTVLFARSL